MTREEGLQMLKDQQKLFELEQLYFIVTEFQDNLLIKKLMDITDGKKIDEKIEVLKKIEAGVLPEDIPNIKDVLVDDPWNPNVDW